MNSAQHLDAPVSVVMRRDVTTLRQEMTVQEALDAIRREGAGEKIVYFYVVDDRERLVGVVPTRRLLTAPLSEALANVMIKRVVALPQDTRILEACEAFIMHRFLALPVVDDERRVVGVVDVSLLTEEAFDLAEREQTEAIFESIGFKVSKLRGASPGLAFWFRFPWLLTTIVSGTICAFLASAYETTLARSLVLAFFLTLVLGLGESVSMQSMTVAIQALRARKPTFHWYVQSLKQELVVALFLASACGVLVGAVVWARHSHFFEALAIGGGIWFSLLAACGLGLSVPTLLHALKLDLKIAAGPVTLALTDIATLAAYFTLASYLL
ncbi:MAG: CBS domain-containing protein [Verrucomicrobiae bacterium]|nr:CBS domain-containing protein [Verrucomicrobiae bacterium]